MFDPHVVADAPVRRVLAPIAFALVFAFGAPAVAANTFFAVVPVSAAGTPGQMRPVKIALASATPPAAHVGEPYEFNLGALLSLDGPDARSGFWLGRRMRSLSLNMCPTCFEKVYNCFKLYSGP